MNYFEFCFLKTEIIMHATDLCETPIMYPLELTTEQFIQILMDHYFS